MPVLTGLRLERARASKQFRDGKFHNIGGVELSKESAKPGTIGELVFGGKARVPHGKLPVERPQETWAKAVGESKLRITWLGHSTLLIESGGIRVLTDPVFGDRASPVSFAGPKRFHAVPATIAELPKVDAVLLSHDHYDHLCEGSMREIARMEVPVVTSLGVGARLESFGVRPALIHEVDWWESIALLGNRLSFTAVPAQHFSGRGLLDRNDTLWSSFVIETDHHRLFFSGDTGLHDEMTTIGRKFGSFDAIMLEIGAWNAAWGTIHLGPENALKAFEMLGGGTLLPVHWGTFDLALHKWSEPAETLLGLAEAKKTRVLTPTLGRPFEPANVEKANPWWRLVDGEGADAQLLPDELSPRRIMR